MSGLNIFSMFWHAGPMVKFIMLLLLGFSGYSWFVAFQKFMLFKNLRIESEEFLEVFWKSKDLSEANDSSAEMTLCPEAAIFKQGFTELQKLSDSEATPDEDLNLELKMAGMDNLKRTLEKAVSQETERVSKSLSFLATTASATPFIGLFGTVWGIMNSFHEIGKLGSASLSVVAPGISEALVATAAGLAVAIPAVVAYNYFSNVVADLESGMHHFAGDFMNLVGRDVLTNRD